jgi:hypothetical protein
MTFANSLNSVEQTDVATLVFDSSKQAGPVDGIRGTAAVARQLLFQAGSLCIDMCMQPRPGTDAIVLVGQLLDSRHPEHGMRNIPVQLLCEGNTISDKKTNDLGEFEFGVQSQHDMQLSFGIAGRRKLVVPLPLAPTIA